MALAFVALQGAIVFAWWRWLAPRSAGLTAAERAMCAGVLAVAQIVGISLLLGWCGLLARRPLLLLVLATSIALLCDPAAVRAWRAGRHRGPDGGRDTAGGAPRAIGRVNLALAALLGSTLVLVAARGVLAPDFGWDGLRYHLPMSALMWQTGQFDFPPMPTPIIAAYPKAAEIWAHWILAFFGHDRWLGLAQLPFLLLAMLATYNGARRLAASRGAAVTGALLLPCAPVVLSQVTVAYNDLLLAAALLVALALALAARQVATPALPLGLGAALGLLLGTKFTALLFAPLLYAAFAVSALRLRGRRALPGLALAAGLALLLGGDTYLRNAWQHGNPVYPFRTTVFGWALAGPTPDTAVFGIAETRHLSPLGRLLRSWSSLGELGASALFGGFGVAGPWLGVVLALALVVAVRERDAPRLALFALFAVLVILTPLNFRVRFTIYLLGFGGICLSHLLDRTAPPARAALLVAMLAVAAVTSAQLWRVELPRLRRAGADRSDACRAAPIAATRPAYLWLRGHAPPGSTVLTFPPPDSPFLYCLWTPTFSNRVEFASAAGAAELAGLAATHPGAWFFLPHGSPVHGVFAATDPRAWRTLFRDDAVTIVTPAGGARAPIE